MNIEILHKINDIKVLVFGDFMVDKYISGNVSRISPEAPVPIVEVTNENEKLGGAGNVINNIMSLGGKVKVLGCIGDDKAGDFIKDYFKNIGTDTSYLKQYRDVNTIIKTRIVSKNQQFLRIDEEKKEPLISKYYKYIEDNLNEIFSDINVIVISDYGKGSVTYDVAQLLIGRALHDNIPVIVDPKGNDYRKYTGATICTPNVKELSDVSHSKIITEDDIKINGQKLCNEIKLQNLILTRSEKGISSIDKDGNKSDFPALAKEVIDVSGAGDTVVATIALLEGLKMPISEICKLANFAASVVVSKFGTATVSLNELICSITNSGEFKYQSIDTLKYIIEDYKDKGKKVVFTNGCFDMLHVGHITSFKEAREFGDVLVVAVNSDQSVKSNKGDKRPIIPENDRIEMICELECVDYVVKMDDKTPEKIIKYLEPDICVKGKDWENKDVPERKIIENYGGQIKFIELNKGHSTTEIINKILDVYGEK